MTKKEIQQQLKFMLAYYRSSIPRRQIENLLNQIKKGGNHGNSRKKR